MICSTNAWGSSVVDVVVTAWLLRIGGSINRSIDWVIFAGRLGRQGCSSVALDINVLTMGDLVRPMLLGVPIDR